MHRLLLLFDVEGWAFHNRALALKRYAPPDFEVHIAAWPTLREVPPHDLVFQLDSSVLRRFSDRPHVFSWNSDPNRRRERWARTYAFADWIVCNNREAWRSYGQSERTCAISNGVDTEIFKVTSPISSRPQRVFWTGSGTPAKKKGLEIIEAARPELERQGFEIAAFPVESAADAPFDVAGMVEQYNQSGYVLCLSESDSTPNTSLEGMACGCCLVTTWVGNVVEMSKALSLRDSAIPALLVERDPNSLITILGAARGIRQGVAEYGRDVIHSRWSYGPPGNRADYFFHLFRALIERRPVRPFCYDSLTPQEV